MQIVIGTGTGRCGTKSLKALFDLQGDTRIYHERYRMSWAEDIPYLDWVMQGLQHQGLSFVGDIGPWYLSYAQRLVKKWDARLVILQRSRNLTVDSFLRQRFDHCSLHPAPGEGVPGPMATELPKYSGNRAEAAGLFWDDFYAQAQRIVQTWPGQAKIFPTNDLNSGKGQRGILTFIGLEGKYHRTGSVDPRYTFTPSVENVA